MTVQLRDTLCHSFLASLGESARHGRTAEGSDDDGVADRTAVAASRGRDVYLAAACCDGDAAAIFRAAWICRSSDYLSPTSLHHSAPLAGRNAGAHRA